MFNNHIQYWFVSNTVEVSVSMLCVVQLSHGQTCDGLMQRTVKSVVAFTYKSEVCTNVKPTQL